jgi:thiol-disulfide isomerase/thioredoxin
MSRGKRSRRSAPASPGSRRARGRPAQSPRRALSGRISWVIGGVILATAIAVIAVAAGSGGSSAASGAGSPSAAAASSNQAAPDGSFTTTQGATDTIASLHGQPTLLWFVTTWCSSCQAGTQAMSAEIPTLAARHVRVVELELYGDLGQPGPAIGDFARQLAGSRLHDPDWTFGTASPALTQAYDPDRYLDIYYLIDAAGRIAYANSSPAATMSQLLSAAARVARNA